MIVSAREREAKRPEVRGWDLQASVVDFWLLEGKVARCKHVAGLIRETKNSGADADSGLRKCTNSRRRVRLNAGLRTARGARFALSSPGGQVAMDQVMMMWPLGPAYLR